MVKLWWESIMNKFKENFIKKWRKFSKNTRRNIGAAAYVIVFAGIITAIAFGYRSPIDSQLADSDIKSHETSVASTVNQGAYLDNVTEASVATGIADEAKLSIANAVRERRSTLAAKAAIAQNNEMAISKPTITIGSSNALTTYTVVDGDSVLSIAGKFAITEQTLRWANDLTSSDAVGVGNVLTIPSVDGVVYTVKDGDDLNAIAEKYQSNASRIIALNGLGESGLVPGETIVLPDGVLPETERPGYVAPVSTGSNFSYHWSTSQATVYAGNRYYWGQCVWYAYNRRAEIGRPVGSLWGNANTWDYYARAAGYAVNQTPAVGAVFQTKGGWYGHVGVVEAVNPDGSIYISEMNYVGVGVKSFRTIPNPLYDSYAGAIVYIH